MDDQEVSRLGKRVLEIMTRVAKDLYPFETIMKSLGVALVSFELTDCHKRDGMITMTFRLVLAETGEKPRKSD